MRNRLLATGIALLTFVGGCSSDSDPKAPSSPGTTTAPADQVADDLPDPCSLLTGAEVDAATGDDFGAGAINAMVTQETMAACDWPGPGIDVVQVLVSNVNLFETNKTTSAELFGSVEDVSVPGAARAFVVKGGSQLTMDMGPILLQIGYVTADDDVTDVTLDLATKAAGRLN